MSKDPAFLFYSSDFLTGTMLMSNEEVGIYIRLLCLQHQQGTLTEDDIKSIGNFTNKIKSKFLVNEDGNYYNQRLEEEREKRRIHGEKQRQNVMKRWKKNDTVVIPSYNFGNTVVIPLENEIEIVNENINNKYFNNKEVNNIFKEYLSVRKKMKMVNTDRAIKALINKLENYDDDIKIKMIEQSIVNSWKNIYDLKQETKTPAWFDKNIKSSEVNEEEAKELENILNKY